VIGRWGVSQNKQALSPYLPTSPSPQLLAVAYGEIPGWSKKEK